MSVHTHDDDAESTAAEVNEKVTVLGIGADGWDGLSVPAQSALREAEVVFGGDRQLAMLPAEVTAEQVGWPSPLLAALPSLIGANRHRRAVVLASGDPMFFGIGSTLARLIGPDSLRVITHPSSVSLACARLGWPIEDVDVVTVVGRPVAAINPSLQPRRRVLVLLDSADSADEVAALLTRRGFGQSALTLLADIGGPGEATISATAASWSGGGGYRLALLALDLVLDPAATALPRTPGLPDEAFEHDGQITKREIRAVTLSALGPSPGELLWDVGAGSGSVGIEWMRTHPACHCIAIEPRPERLDRITRNADSLGVPGLAVVEGTAPEALADLPTPDAIFVGGGVSVPGVIEACLDALAAGGRLVANGVTLETESVLARWHARLGGSLLRIAVQRAEPVGGFTGWRPGMPVTQWAYVKSHAAESHAAESEAAVEAPRNRPHDEGAAQP